MELIVGLCFAITCIFAQVRAQTPDFEGNVQLSFNGNVNYEGVLQVYSQGKWNVVCYQMNGTIVTNVGAAAAACRQKKHTTFTKWGSATRLGYNNPADLHSTAISGIRCPEVKFPSSEGDIFLLRCDNSDELIPKEGCEEFVGIQCSTFSSGDQPYNGQVRRIKESDGDRTELLQINFDNTWLPVCTKNMSSSAGDSACRQIGYTGSSHPPISSNDQKKSWKIDDLSACNVSFPCFTDCIKRSSVTLVEHCDENQYEVICEFDKSLDGIFSAGNKYLCTYQAEKTQALQDAGIAAMIILGFIIIGTVIGILFCIFKVYQHHRRNGHNRLPNDVQGRLIECCL